MVFNQRRRVVVDGHLLHNNPTTMLAFQIHWGRAIAAVLLLGVLWFSNPYHTPTLHPDTTQHFLSSQKKQQKQPPQQPPWTDFGVFAVRERKRRDGLTFYALTQDWTCWYHQDQYDAVHDACRTLRDLLCHQRPLVWYPRDWAYTTHRVIMAIYLFLGVLRWCTNLDYYFLDQSSIASCFLSLLVPASPWSVIEAHWFLYPAWERMKKLVPMQQPNSIFRFFGDNTDANYWSSVVILYVVASLCVYTTRHYWNTRTTYLSLSPSSHLVAAALGYVRGSFGSERQKATSLLLLPTPWKLSPISATWTMFALQLVLSGGGIGSLIPWWVAHTCGSIMGEYQFQNQQLVYLVDSLWNGLRDSIRSLLDF